MEALFFQNSEKQLKIPISAHCATKSVPRVQWHFAHPKKGRTHTSHRQYRLPFPNTQTREAAHSQLTLCEIYYNNKHLSPIYYGRYGRLKANEHEMIISYPFMLVQNYILQGKVL